MSGQEVRRPGKVSKKLNYAKWIFPKFFSSSLSESLEITLIMFKLLGVLLNRVISCLHVATIVFSASIVLKPDLDPKTGWLDIQNCTMHMYFIVIALHCSISSPLVNGRKLSPALQDNYEILL